MKAIISPYEPVIDDKGDTVFIPSVVVDFPSDFSSSDIPSTILDAQDGERLIILPDDVHAQAIAMGYIGVEVNSWL